MRICTIEPASYLRMFCAMNGGFIHFVSVLAFMSASPLYAREPTEAEKLFALKVKPLFSEKCFACHGDDPDKIKGEFDMTSLELLKKAGHTIGATDDIGAEAVDQVRHLRDFHITLLKLLGLDDSRLTYYHGGRFKQLSQFGGEAISELIA